MDFMILNSITNLRNFRITRTKKWYEGFIYYLALGADQKQLQFHLLQLDALLQS